MKAELKLKFDQFAPAFALCYSIGSALFLQTVIHAG